MKKLTIVVGAGASHEYGLPLGSGLTKQIASLLDIKFDLHQQKSGDQTIRHALDIVARENGLRDISTYQHAAWRIRDAMPQARSIDNFIDSQQGDEKIEICGKLAIVKAILNAEKNSTLFVRPSNVHNQIQFERTSGFWLHQLTALIIENCQSKGLESRLAGLCFVIFNYDRCVEHYLFYALRNYYQLGTSRAAELLNTVDFFHPYGVVGSLPWQEGNDRAEFGEELHHSDLLKNARQIKTFTEGTDPDSSEITNIRRAVAYSETVLFLGFAFHRLNMQLLNSTIPPEQQTGRERTYATAFLMSQSDAREVGTEICQMRRCNPDRVEIRTDLTASKIFSEYTRGISLI